MSRKSNLHAIPSLPSWVTIISFMSKFSFLHTGHTDTHTHKQTKRNILTHTNTPLTDTHKDTYTPRTNTHACARTHTPAHTNFENTCISSNTLNTAGCPFAVQCGLQCIQTVRPATLAVGRVVGLVNDTSRSSHD